MTPREIHQRVEQAYALLTEVREEMIRRERDTESRFLASAVGSGYGIAETERPGWSVRWRVGRAWRALSEIQTSDWPEEVGAVARTTGATGADPLPVQGSGRPKRDRAAGAIQAHLCPDCGDALGEPEFRRGPAGDYGTFCQCKRCFVWQRLPG